MNIKCITFDLDDTLWACQPLIEKAEQRFYHWLTINRPQVSEHYTRSEMTAHRVKYAQSHSAINHNLTQLRKNWLSVLSTECGYDDDWIEDGFNVFWIARNEPVLFPGTERMLSELKQHFTLGAITNGNADIALCGLGDYFDFSVHSEEVGASKPDPRVFDYALNLSGFLPHEVIHIGDDPVRDIIAAKKVGMKTVWANIDNNNWPEEGDCLQMTADAAITTLHDLASVVRGVSALNT